MSASYVIECDELSFSYEKTPILENISLTVAAGEFIGIFGPNGGGKTTFLKLLMGFLKPTHGHVRLFGRSPLEARSSIGYVPQAMLYDKQFPITVLELVTLGALSEISWWGGGAKSVKEKACAALKKVGLDGKEELSFGTLSGGQAQRALIARALVSDPKLLLLDEPTANVDPQAEAEIYDLLSALKGSMTILMVTHDLQTILGKAEHLLCIHRKATSYLPSEVCDHFSLGLYHPPASFPKGKRP